MTQDTMHSRDCVFSPLSLLFCFFFSPAGFARKRKPAELLPPEVHLTRPAHTYEVPPGTTTRQHNKTTTRQQNRTTPLHTATINRSNHGNTWQIRTTAVQLLRGDINKGSPTASLATRWALLNEHQRLLEDCATSGIVDLDSQCNRSSPRQHLDKRCRCTLKAPITL